jgi:hypothetical protein
MVGAKGLDLLGELLAVHHERVQKRERGAVPSVVGIADDLAGVSGDSRH